MRLAGQIVLIPFPFTDLSGSKLRPALLLRQTSSRFDDWLICMISSQIQQADPDLDETVKPADADYGATGLKTASVIRLARLAVVDGQLLCGALGTISDERLNRLRHRLAAWLVGPG